MGIRETLKARLTAGGLRPSTRLGQNFLLDTNLLGAIARTAGAGPDDIILEVGPGTGFLTKHLAETGARILTVELDHGLLPLARETVADFPGVSFIEGDILEGKNGINPRVTAELTSLLSEYETQGRQGRLFCVSNLPYSAGTPLVMNLLSSPLPWATGVFLLQKEVAERITASPGSKEYGALSIYAALAAVTGVERIVPPQAFWPRPKVDSALIKMDFLPVADRSALPWSGLRAVCRAIFSARRKNLRNALDGLMRPEEILPRLGISPGDRGETLTPAQFLLVARQLSPQI